MSINNLKQLLNDRLPAVLKHLLPYGKFLHSKFYVGDVNGNKGRSLVVELKGPKAGIWHDFATRDGGNILSLWAAASKTKNKTELIASIEKWLGISPSKSANHPTESKPTGKWDYLDEDRGLLVSVYRYDTPSGKYFQPYDAKSGKYKAPEIRPLYNLPGIKLSSNVVVVEGEKAAQALIDIGICATTAMNGANAQLDKTDWSPLRKKNILIWPDNDAAGKKYAKLLSQKLKAENPYAIAVVNVPGNNPLKWDAADAVSSNDDINTILKNKTYIVYPPAPFYSGGHAIDKKDPGPADLVFPSVLTEGGLCVIGGAPKTGKSDFLLHWLIHMSMGLDFIGMKTSRPLRIAYIQVEVRYHAMCKRIQDAIHSMQLNSYQLELFRKNLFFTPHMKLTLDESGIELIKRTVLYYFNDAVDVIAIDPLRYVFDGGRQDKTENDNGAMRLFLQDRIDVLRDSINPRAANILVHHTKKILVDQLEEEEFQALSGASALHGYFSTGILMYRPDKKKPQRKLIFELRDGEPINYKHIQKIEGLWREVKELPLDSINLNDKQRKILNIINSEANKDNIYTINQFCKKFNSKDLGSVKILRGLLNKLVHIGYIKFSNTPKDGRRTSSKYGYLYAPSSKDD